MNFGQAIEAMKDGYRVARSGWNERGMWICLGNGSTALRADEFWNAHTRKFAGAQPGAVAEVLPYFIMKTEDNKILMGWLASQPDMLATDWGRLIIGINGSVEFCPYDATTMQPIKIAINQSGRLCVEDAAQDGEFREAKVAPAQPAVMGDPYCKEEVLFTQAASAIKAGADDPGSPCIEARHNPVGAAPIITQAHIDSIADGYNIFNVGASMRAMNVPYMQSMDLLTICVITTKNGFTVTGESACASPENFDQERGNAAALKNAKDKLWSLEGYLLKQRLFNAANPGAAAAGEIQE